MSYRVQFVTSAAKEFRSLPAAVKSRAATVIDGLRENPRPSGVSKLQAHARLYRLSVGQFRIVKVDDEQQRVLVTRIRHRRDVYQGR